MQEILDLFIATKISANLFYMAIPLILLAVVVSASYLDRKSVPVILVALFAGIIFGSDGLKFWNFDNVKLANDLANLALVLILFHGGFCTKKENLKSVALPALGLATWGVVLTAIFTFVCLHFLLGWDRNVAILLSVIISSTDAAAIFSILSKQALDDKLKSTIEIESGANDPMAILLTVVAIQALTSGGDLSYGAFAGLFLWKFISAPILGFVIAKCMVWLINKLTPQESGYYHILLLCTPLFAYGFSEVFNASGMLAAFTAGIVMGNKQFVHKQGVYHFSSAVSTIANILLFVLLGVLVSPSSWLENSVHLSGKLFLNGILLFLFLSFIARPAAIFLGTIGMKIPFRDRLFIAWAGLRGAVPISLATYPAAAGMASGMEIFNLVFFAVLLSVGFQGSSLGKIAKLLKLSTPSRPEPPYSLEFFTKSSMDTDEKMDLFTVDLPGPEDAQGPFIRDLELPEDALLLMITRKQKQLKKQSWQVLPPKGDIALCGLDQITVLSKIEDEEKVKETLLKSFEKEAYVDLR
ncbi:MAG: potassium/proton antiporter [Fibromonadaceae bacterium]|jgi:cell volume regulation protein A|nr:potassium/proton antiporter [Fibromonadaceae bacterium]